MSAPPKDGKQEPVLLLAPSLGRGAGDFAEVAALLVERGHRVVAPEPFGLDSRQSLDNADLALLASHVLAALAPEDRSVVAIGHAFGNRLARMAAVLRPDLVKAVVLLAAAHQVIPDAIRPSIDGSFNPALRDSERLQHLRRAYFAPGNDASQWLGGWYPALAEGQRAATKRSDRSLWWHAGGSVPILDIQAAEDAIAPPGLADLRAELGERVTTVTIENAGHALLPEQPVRVAVAIDAFVRGLNTSGNRA